MLYFPSASHLWMKDGSLKEVVFHMNASAGAFKQWLWRIFGNQNMCGSYPWETRIAL
jgi:hypothetical protein